MEPTAKSVRIFIPPSRVGAGVSRIVELPDGSGRVETWGPDGWAPGGAGFDEFFETGLASPAFMDRLGIPESERAESGEVPDVTA